MKGVDIPVSLNFILWSIISFASLALLTIAPAALENHPYMLAALIILLIPLNTPFWSLIHEGIHRNLHPHKRINEIMSRSMAVIFGASFHILRFGHMMHHQYNRKWESEVYEPRRQNIIPWIGHFVKMLGGLYVTEVALSFIVAVTPRAIAHKIADRIFHDERQRQALYNMLLKPENVRQVRIDCLLIVILYATAFYMYGQNAALLLLLVAGRALMISLMDNAYHYGTPMDNSVPAKELRAPALVSKLILNFNYHMTHHKNAAVSWIHLPQWHQAQKNDYAGSLLPALFEQFKGPLPAEQPLLDEDTLPAT